MADEVKEVKQAETPKAVETPKTVSVEEYEALKTKLSEYEGSFKEMVNKASKAEREKFEKQLAKEKLSAEERIKLEQEEKWNAVQSELNTLKTEKKQFVVKQHLTESGLPPFFTNDSRLVNASVDDVPNVIKAIRKEYDEYVKETSKPAVVGTAPKTPTNESSNSAFTGDLIKKYPYLAGLKVGK